MVIKSKEKIPPFRINLKIDRRLNRQLEEVCEKVIPRRTKQRYIEEALIKQIGADMAGAT
jgi:hypothetical protein